MIKDTCKCGAEFQATDPDGWAPNERAAHAKWLSAHAECRRAHAGDECTRAAFCSDCGGKMSHQRVNMRGPLEWVCEDCGLGEAEDECTRAHATVPDVCPGCGGPADNGRNLCDPPMPYYCARCVAMEAFYNER